MKKLVAIALVLALASMANAGVAFVAYDSAGTTALTVAGGKVSVNPGNLITIKMINTGNTSVGFDIGVITDTGRVGTASDLFTNASLTSDVSPGYVENSQAASGGIGALISLWSKATTGTALASGSTLGSFHYLVAGSGDVVISTAPAGTYYSALDSTTYDFNASTAGFGFASIGIDSVTLNVVPEPMTLGLLSLGGLFLRRRLA